MKPFAVGLVCLMAIELGAARVDGEQKQLVPKEVTQLVVPILDSAAKAQKEPDNVAPKQSEWIRVEKQLYALLGNRSPAADEALVVLMHFYIGEATGEDLEDEIVARGPRMLSRLRKYRCCVPRITGRDYSAQRIFASVVKTDIDALIQRIQKGEKRTVR